VSNSPARPSEVALARRRGIRAPRRFGRFHLREEVSGRCRGSLAVPRCPPWPSRVSPRAGPPRTHRPGRASSRAVKSVRDPPDLGADSRRVPVLAAPAVRPELPLLGLSKDRPSIVRTSGSPSPGGRCRSVPAPSLLPLRDGNAGSHPRSVRVVSHHLDGFLLHDAAAVLQAAADPGVHHVSPCRETGFPAVRSLPFEAFPPPTASGPRRSLRARGPRHRVDRLRSPVHRVPCLLALSLPACTALSRR
jgi:hypothetical protein